MTSQEPPPTPDDNNPTSGLPSYGSFDQPASGETPPPYQGNQPPVSGPTPFSATDAISYGWKKFRENAGPILLAALILIAVSIVLSIIGRSFDGGNVGSGMFSVSVSSLIFQTLSTVVTYIVGAAIIRGALDVTEGKTFDLGSAFSRLPIANVIITSLIVSVLESIGFILLIIPGLLVAFFTVFAMYFVVDKNQNPIEAITSSFNLVKDHIGDTLLLILLSIVVIIAGAIALCVGLLVALPIVIIATAYAFRKFQGEPVAP
ncbi:MAG: hypothetical protein M3Q98_08455 [Actinomycetota bacterium]|nr:hypothetical protein [Actinomycetota bacterium]